MPHVTLLYGGLMGLLQVGLGITVSLVRTKHNSFKHGSPDVPPFLHSVIRAHGNLTEWGPMLVVLLLLVELGGATSMWLHVAGGVMVVMRLLHAVGMIFKLKTQIVGAMLTWVIGLWLGTWAVMLHFR